jgi:hypothetical protein
LYLILRNHNSSLRGAFSFFQGVATRDEDSYEKLLSLVQTVELAFGMVPGAVATGLPRQVQIAEALRLWEKLIPKSNAALRHAIWASCQLK